MAQHGSLKNLRTSWTADDDRSLAQTVKTVTAQGGSLRDAYTQAARELHRSFEGTRTRAQFLRESAPPSTRQWVDHGIRLVGTPSAGFTVKTSRAAARKTRAADAVARLNSRVGGHPYLSELGDDDDIATLTIEGVTLTGSPSDLYLFAPAFCRGIVRDIKTRS